MKKIFKYQISLHGGSNISMPKGAYILSCGQQSSSVEDGLVVWAILDPDQKESENRCFESIFTGELYNAGNNYYGFVGTVQHTSGLVIHIFEVASSGHAFTSSE